MLDFPQIGRMAPNFLTVGVYKNRLGQIRLSDYYGKKYVILVFYPANFTSVSLTELIGLSNRISEFRKLSAQILAISIDSPFSHLHYLLSKPNQGGLGKLNYPLISDLNQSITSTYKLLTDDEFYKCEKLDDINDNVMFIDTNSFTSQLLINNKIAQLNVNATQWHMVCKKKLAQNMTNTQKSKLNT